MLNRLAGIAFMFTALFWQTGAVYAELPSAYHDLFKAGEFLDGRPGPSAWADDGSGLWHRAHDRLQLIDPESGNIIADFDAGRLQQSMAEQFGPMSAVPLPMEALRAVDTGTLEFEWLEAMITYREDTGEVSFDEGKGPVPPGRFIRNRFLFDGNPVPDLVAASGEQVATIIDGNVHVRSRGSNEWRQLTDNASERHGWDLASGKMNMPQIRSVATNAFAPSGAYLFAQKIDRTGMPVFPALNIITDDVPTVVNHDDFRAGGPYYIYQPAIVDIAAGNVMVLSGIDVSNEHVLFLDWDEGSEFAWFAAINRDFSEVRVMRASARDGTAEVVYTEKGGRGLVPPHQAYYVESVGFTLLPGNLGFLFESQRDGWKHLYHYDLDGGLVRQITSGEFPVANVEHIDTTKERVYFMARSDLDRPYDLHLHSVKFDGSGARQHTTGRGVHAVAFSPDGTYFSDAWSSPSMPPSLSISTSAGEKRHVVAQSGTERLEALGWTPPVEFVAKAADGETDVYGTMYLPLSFDASGSYPIIEEIYGGLFLIKGDHEFLASPYTSQNYPLALTALGYIVVRFDTPGTIGRSRDFGTAVDDKWGPGVIADHAAVIRALGEQYEYADSSRVGIFGHSWGGYYALMALALEGDTYDAAISTAPGVYSDSSRGDAFMEAHLGSPNDNPEAWDRANFFRYVDSIENPLLLGVGNRDYGLYAAVIRITDALIKRGFQHEVMIAPTMGHGIYGPYESYFFEKSTRFLLKHVPVGAK